MGQDQLAHWEQSDQDSYYLLIWEGLYGSNWICIPLGTAFGDVGPTKLAQMIILD